MSAIHLSKPGTKKLMPVIGVFAPCDPRIDEEARTRAKNIIVQTAHRISNDISLPDGTPVSVVYSDMLIDGEHEADYVAAQFKESGVNILIGVPDTWAFPQLTLLSLLAHFPSETPLLFVTGNSGPKPGVVFTHAVSGAIAQTGKLMHIIVGSWPDSGLTPAMTPKTKDDMMDWVYAAVTKQHLKGKRVVIFGHDSMGMETALPHIFQTRETFGIEITRLDMKLLADMLAKKSYRQTELNELWHWLYHSAGSRIAVQDEADTHRMKQSLAMYLIVRDVMQSCDAVGGGFMSQLEWGSDTRGIPLPVADVMESLFNSTFDHTGDKPVIPYATEADVQGLLTMLFMTYLSGGNPPLFMDFRKVWEASEVQTFAKKIRVPLDPKALWVQKGFVDGDNSGSASFDWAALPGTPKAKIMEGISFPQADPNYFPGLGNSVAFITPGGIEGIAARLAYSHLSGMFSFVWDEAVTAGLPKKLAKAVSQTSNETWPHTFVVPKHASMVEYKQYAPANHFHMTWNLNAARLQYWMDLANVLSVTPWAAMPSFREGIDRPSPLLYVINGGENTAKMLLHKKR